MNKETSVAIVLLLILLLIFAPIVIIWSLNTLFNLAIPYTLQTWASALILSAAVKGVATIKR